MRPLTSTSTIANALPCGSDILPTGYFSRPLIGSINFNTNSIFFNNFDPTNEISFDYSVKVALHEAIHALGFTYALYPDFVSPTGGHYTGKYGPAKLYSRANNISSLYRLESPRVVAVAREHFNCSTLEGYELENLETESSQAPGSHFEKYVPLSPLAPSLIV